MKCPRQVLKTCLSLLLGTGLLMLTPALAHWPETPRLDGVVVLAAASGVRRCTAVVIANRDNQYWALSAGHCFRGGFLYAVDFERTESGSQVKVVRQNGDIVLITFRSRHKYHAYKVWFREPKPGSPVWIAGAYMDKGGKAYVPLVSAGVWIGLKYDWIENSIMRSVYGAGMPGFSGGPIFYRGAILGVAVAGTEGNPHSNWIYGVLASEVLKRPVVLQPSMAEYLGS